MKVLQTGSFSEYGKIIESFIGQGATLGIAIIKALIILVIGKILINLISKIVRRLLRKKGIDPSVQSFVGSLINVTLIILLIISVIGVLGIQTTSFAALLASIGVAIGMALSGNLSNFAGGILILLFRPFKVGDFITAQGISGTVVEIQIFHTILNSPDNIRQYIPNGSLSSGVVTNFNVDKRRVEWIFGVDYGEDYDKVKTVIEKILAKESRLLPDPAPFIALHALDSSSVNIIVRAWVGGSAYWDVYFDMNKEVYATFNAEGINFPFPQLTVHQV
ncbi:MAG: mechanosensitive ion channel [Mediterranea sp.]|jgi:small conductance mechanosensitive channel|nr:mechanosensitive ion channel [Mediterranea sp.]